jgi:methionyl-tRNA formyltransferase
MKVALLCHGTVLQPAIETLYIQNLLVGIGVPGVFRGVNDTIKHAASAFNLPFTYLPKENLEKSLSVWLEDLKPDVVCMMGYPYQIPVAVLQYPRYGFFNLHGGKLPEYPGADPVFWQLKNMESEGAITVHRVEPDMDTGAVAHVEPVPLSVKDTYGTVIQRLGQLLPRALVAFIQQLAIHRENLPLVRQKKGNGPVQRSRPEAVDQAVNWEESPRRIDALVRSCNPIYNGALTVIRKVPVRVLSVKLFQSASDTKQSPGTILKADPQEGITVSCGGQGALIIEIICTEGGFYTGGQFAELINVRAGEAFTPFPSSPN